MSANTPDAVTSAPRVFNLSTDLATEEPSEGEQIEQGQNGHGAQAVFGDAGGAGPVCDRDLAHLPATRDGEGGEKRVERADG